MKVAVIGSRGLTLDNLGQYLPETCTEIVSGGARGIDTGAKFYAKAHGIPLKEFLPDYQTYGGGAPLVRNRWTMPIWYWRFGTANLMAQGMSLNTPSRRESL